MVDEVMPTDIFVPVPGNINVNLVSNPVITVEPVI